MMTQVQTK